MTNIIDKTSNTHMITKHALPVVFMTNARVIHCKSGKEFEDTEVPIQSLYHDDVSQSVKAFTLHSEGWVFEFRPRQT